MACEKRGAVGRIEVSAAGGGRARRAEGALAASEGAPSQQEQQHYRRRRRAVLHGPPTRLLRRSSAASLDPLLRPSAPAAPFSEVRSRALPQLQRSLPHLCLPRPAPAKSLLPLGDGPPFLGPLLWTPFSAQLNIPHAEIEDKGAVSSPSMKPIARELSPPCPSPNG